MESSLVIKLHKLSKTYRGSEKPAVENLSLEIAQGAFFGLLGPNGAGKTTSLSMLSGLLPPSSGSIEFQELSWQQHARQIKKQLGVVPQDIALHPLLNADENLDYYGALMGLKRKDLTERKHNLLRQFGLYEHRKKLVKHYSGGMKRRLNLIAGILHTPSVVLLDEPTVGVDVQSRQVILDFLRTYHRMGNTIIYTSHYLEEAENLCSYVAIIDEGHIIEQGSVADLLEQHKVEKLETLFLHLTGKALRD
ncbi:MAG: ABC transporter ATP-binding protein [Bacteroidales bacterium]